MCCGCFDSREMQYKWSSPEMKEPAHQGKHGIILHNFPFALFCLGHNCLSCEANPWTLTNQFWRLFFSVCLHVDILFCHFPSRRRHRNQTFKGKRFIWTLLMFSRPPTVALLRSMSASTHLDNGASSDINIYILQLCSTRKQTVAWETSAGCCWFSSLSVFFCLCLSLFPSLSLLLTQLFL